MKKMIMLFIVAFIAINLSNAGYWSTSAQSNGDGLVTNNGVQTFPNGYYTIGADVYTWGSTKVPCSASARVSATANHWTGIPLFVYTNNNPYSVTSSTSSHAASTLTVTYELVAQGYHEGDGNIRLPFSSARATVTVTW
jgi:hypothetical protein